MKSKILTSLITPLTFILCFADISLIDLHKTCESSFYKLIIYHLSTYHITFNANSEGVSPRDYVCALWYFSLHRCKMIMSSYRKNIESLFIMIKLEEW